MDERKGCIRCFASGLQQKKNRKPNCTCLSPLCQARVQKGSADYNPTLAMFWHTQDYLSTFVTSFINQKVKASNVGLQSPMYNSTVANIQSTNTQGDSLGTISTASGLNTFICNLRPSKSSVGMLGLPDITEKNSGTSLIWSSVTRRGKSSQGQKKRGNPVPFMT